MNFRHPLPLCLQEQAIALTEFANGAAQCHVKLCDGRLLPGALISNSSALVAIRGFKSLPFKIEEVQALVQMEDDTRPVERGNWDYFDDWTSTGGTEDGAAR